MPKRTDISSILVIGAGPIIIGQACEFDYSGTQAIKALKEEGYRVILVNSNPATIMTDPEFADATYIEPITPEVVEKIIAKEKPDALLPTMGGQTALNCALKLFESGALERHGVQMIGADADAIDKAENRQRFREAMDKIGLESARSRTINADDLVAEDRAEYKRRAAELSGDALDKFETEWRRGEQRRKEKYVAAAIQRSLDALDFTGLPAIIRPSFTLGGTGGGIAYNKSEFERIVREGLDASLTNVWRIEVDPSGEADARFVYQLTRRNDPSRLFRVAFDAGEPVPAPPPAWGWE